MLPSPDSVDFPLKLKLKRLSLGLSRFELAKKAGFNQTLIRRYEEPNAKDFCKPSTKTLRLLNDALMYFSSTVPVINEQPLLIPEERLLKDATAEELLQALQIKIKEIQNVK